MDDSDRRLEALIVEDSKFTRNMIMRALEQAGLADFRFTEAEDGVDALDKFRPGETEIIFVDMNMPRMGGLEFIRALRSKYKVRPPTVMLTAESSREKLAEAINESGVDAVMLKPVDRDRLKVGLKKLVDSIPQRGAACPVPHGDCVPDALTVTLARICDLALEPTAPDEGLRNGKVVLGMVSIQGEVHWSVTLGFTPDSASAIATRFAGYDIPSEGPDLGDAIGEITNIVAGRIKHNLGGRGLAANISLPTVFGADSLQMLLERDNAMAYAYFDSPVGKLWTLVSVGIDSGVIL